MTGDFWVINPRSPVLVFRLLGSDLPVIMDLTLPAQVNKIRVGTLLSDDQDFC
jgi:hypothetical protein